MKKIKSYKVLSILLSFMICIPLFSSVVVYADDEIPDVPTAIAENYWGELEEDNSVDGGIYPKYLMKIQDSLLKNFKLSKGFYSPSTGVYKDFNTLTYSPVGDMFDYISQPELKENEGPNGDPNYQDNKYHNPFNFSFATDFIRDRDQLNVYGDISVNGNTENTTVATHSVGEELKLDFSVDLSNLSKWQNTRFWQNINGQSAGQLWKINGTESYRATDSELVFVLNMPKGINVPDVDTLKFTVEGLSHIKFKSAKRDGDKLIITVHPSLNNEGYMTAKDYYEYLKSISKIKISIDGLLVNDEIAKDSNITITGSVAGVQDELSTNSEEAAKNKSGAGTDDARMAYFFVGKQSNEGRDVASTQDKPNLISYTFKVNKPANNTVTFINEDVEYSKVKVETDKAIDNDGLTSESMPQNPTKSSYTFKEWNTQKDGKGTAFTGTTVVNEDMTVYAIYSKNAIVINEAPQLEVTDKTIEKGTTLDLKELIISATDKEDGDLKSKVELVDDGGFDKDKVGKYTITFKVTDKGGASTIKKATVTVIEDDKTLPKTGDSSNLVLYGTLMGLSGLLLIALEIRKRRKES